MSTTDFEKRQKKKIARAKTKAKKDEILRAKKDRRAKRVKSVIESARTKRVLVKGDRRLVGDTTNIKKTTKKKTDKSKKSTNVNINISTGGTKKKTGGTKKKATLPNPYVRDSQPLSPSPSFVDNEMRRIAQRNEERMRKLKKKETLMLPSLQAIPDTFKPKKGTKKGCTTKYTFRAPWSHI